MLTKPLRGILFSVLTTCILASGQAAEMTPSDGTNPSEEGLANDISASLVVCGRGARLISSFGHCSIHMTCPSAGLDSYYTYLIHATPANIWRFFTEGICTGRFVMQKWDVFLKDYVEQNRPVTEYRLNLTTDEVRLLWMNLDKETLNPVSRASSFLHSQCTSICADIIRASLTNERIVCHDLPAALTGTLRDFTDHAVAGYPWERFVFQSLLGAEGEQQGVVWEKLAPADVYPVWSQASIVDAAGGERPVFAGEPTVLFNGTYSPEEPTRLTPTVVFAILLALTLLLTLAEAFGGKMRRTAKVLDALLLCVQTLLGLFFTGLLLFSRASWMPGNVLPIVFNPLPALLWVFFHKRKAFRCAYVAYAVVLTAMMVATPFVPQLQWGHALVFATFLVRVAAHIIRTTNHKSLITK